MLFNMGMVRTRWVSPMHSRNAPETAAQWRFRLCGCAAPSASISRRASRVQQGNPRAGACGIAGDVTLSSGASGIMPSTIACLGEICAPKAPASTTRSTCRRRICPSAAAHRNRARLGHLNFADIAVGHVIVGRHRACHPRPVGMRAAIEKTASVPVCSGDRSGRGVQMPCMRISATIR